MTDRHDSGYKEPEELPAYSVAEMRRAGLTALEIKIYSLRREGKTWAEIAYLERKREAYIADLAELARAKLIVFEGEDEGEKVIRLCRNPRTCKGDGKDRSPEYDERARPVAVRARLVIGADLISRERYAALVWAPGAR